MTQEHIPTDPDNAEARVLGSYSAFPGQPFDQQGGATGELWPGLTKREYFAAMAMQGLAGPYASDGRDYSDCVAKLAVSHADALLKELAK